MRNVAQRSIRILLAAVLVSSASGCALLPRHTAFAPRTKQATATTSVYRTTHCTGNGVFTCANSTPSVPQLGACGERTLVPFASAPGSPTNCRVELTAWVSIPTSRILHHTEACAEPLLNFRLADDPSRPIGTSSHVARALDQVSHPALRTGMQELDQSGCGVVSP